MSEDSPQHLNEYNIVGAVTGEPKGLGDNNNPALLKVRTMTPHTKKDGGAGEHQSTHDVMAWDEHAAAAMQLCEGDLVEARGEYRNVRVGKPAGGASEDGEGDDSAGSGGEGDAERTADWRARLVVSEGGTLRRV